MPRGTVIKSQEVETFVVDKMYSSKMLIDRNNSESRGVQINMGIFAPGAKHTDHAHDPKYENDEVYLIIKGEGKLRLDGEEYDVSAGDAVYIPAGTMHALSNKSDTEELTIYTVWTKHPEKGVNDVYDSRVAAWGTSYRTVKSE